MRLLLPKSLGGQLAALLVAGLVTAYVASFLAFSGERNRAVAAAVQFGLLERIATFVEVIDQATPEMASRLADALSSRRVRLVIADQSTLPANGMTTAEARFAGELSEELSLHGGMPRVRFAKSPTDEGGKRSAQQRRRSHLPGVSISIPLEDGKWLNASSELRTPTIGWSWPWLMSLGSTAIITLIAVALLVRRITGPMRALAASADRLGRGEVVAPIPVAGPAEIRTTVEAFNAMQERLSRFIRDRTRMVAAISHDLRTPITSLRLRAEFIEEDQLKADVVRTLDEMQAMTDSTLAFAREDSKGEETRSVDLAAMIEGLVEDQVALGHKIVYSGPERLVWRCRPVGLKRAISNLVENAIRYAGSVRVELAQEDGQATVRVEDDGPGIPEQSLEDVFEPFIRLESSRNRETGGVGLGLSIARSIVHAHGGELALANKGEGGLVATVKLP
ncbi:ATP-binding protein [Aminobacter sp. HY435]|uniref:ATP-binding protein n=1 Tax=Aminobacter sp. HY435 TaxID=2970917 RepID=UPI0022B9BE99|nr:ATP-binding protein [Aminobacter sp. HY435]